MSEYIPIITASIAFLGTALGIIFGYRKWKKDKRVEQFGQYEHEKQEAYKTLWRHVEDFNVKTRIEEINDKQFSEYLQKLNSFLLKGGLYIGETEKNLANQYVKSVYRFQKAVRAANIDEASTAMSETSAIPKDVLNRVQEIRDAQEETLKLRERLLEKIKAVLSGN